MDTILISTSKFGNPVADYYKNLGACFVKKNYRVVYIFDGLFNNYPEEVENIKYYTWKNKRPTKFSDFVFLYKILKKEKPILCISNFGSTNVVSIVSFFLRVKYRINYIHTTSVQLSIDSKRHSILNSLLKYRKKLVYSLNSHFLTNSAGTKKDAINYYGIRENKISVFPLLIKDSPLDYKSFHERENCICIIGRLNPSKGHREFLSLFKECVKKHPTLKLKIIGDGNLKPELIELTKKLHIENNVVFTGSIPNKKINELFSSSLISVSSSIDEAYGLVNIEALREGTPLISTITAGSIDILEEEKNGLFIHLNNEFSFCESFETIINNWDFFSKNALRTFKHSYDMKNIEKHCNELLQFT